MKKICKKIVSTILVFSIFSNISFIWTSFAVETDWSASNWTLQKAEHLARRALFWATPVNVDELYKAWSASQAVDLLFPSVEWPDRTQFNADMSSYQSWTWFSISSSSSMNKFYAYRTYKDPYEAKRKLFWLFEDIFSVDRTWNNLTDITYADVENHFSTLYDETLWNYKTMVKKVLFDQTNPERSFAEGQYLNLLNQPNKDYPNENYARELMQLFLMLEYKPWENADMSWALRNYEESDVASLAKILTWFRAWDDKKVYFDNTYHNTSTWITFLSWPLSDWDDFAFYNTSSWTIDNTKIIESISWNNWVWDNIIDYIFSKRKNEIADFLAWRMYKYYVNDNPTQTEIESLASRLISNNFDIYPTVKYLLSSDMMYSDIAMNSLRYKTPLELVIWTLKLVHYKTPWEFDNLLNSDSILSLLDFTPYNPRSIFWRPGYDNNLVFFNAYFHNQWFTNYASKIANDKTNSVYSLDLSDFIWETRLFESWSINLISNTSNTYSWSVDLENINLTLKNGIVVWQESVEVPLENSSSWSEVWSWEVLSQTWAETWSWTDVWSWAESWTWTSQIPQTQTVLKDIVVNNLSFLTWSLNLTDLTLTTNSWNILKFSWNFDFNSKLATFSSWSLSYSWAEYEITLWNANISSTSTLQRDITVEELLKNLENNLLLWRNLPEDVKQKIINYLTFDINWNKRNFLPNLTSYKDTYIRSAIALILSQAEFILQSWYDLPTQQSNTSWSQINDKSKKLIMVELSWGYDWMHAAIPKEESEYEYYKTIRKELTNSWTDLIDLWDMYLNSNYSAFKEFYDSWDLRIINRVWAPNHSRWHDTAAIQMTSQKALQTIWTPGLIWELIKWETDPLNNIVLWTWKPTMYTNWKYLNIWWNSLKYSSINSDKTYQIKTLKDILSTRTYPWISSSSFVNSETLDDIWNWSGQTSVWYTLSQRLNFTSNLISNNLWITYYVPGWGWYDTHDGEQKPWVYNLNNRTKDLSTDIANFFKTQKELWNDVTIIIFSEFGRTLKTNWTSWTDHWEWWGYFILSTNQNLKNDMPEKIYWKLKPSMEYNDWFWVWIDYRAIYNKILSRLYWVDSVWHFAKEYNLEDYVNSDKPKPILFRNQYRNSSYWNNVKVDLKFDFEDKKMLLKDWSYLKFYRWTDINNLTKESQWVVDNYFIKDWVASLTVDWYKWTKYYYKIDFVDNQYETYSATWSFVIPDKVTTWSWISLTNNTYFTKYNNTVVTNETPIEKFNLFNAWTWTTLTTKTFSNWISMIFGTWETSVSTLSSDWELTWNWWFELPKFVNKDEFLPTTANFSWTNLSSLWVENIIKVWADNLWVWMKLNQNVLLKVPWFDVSKKYWVITSEDWVNWKTLENQTVVNDSWSLIFSTNHFSYFAFVDASNLDCSLNISPKTLDLWNDYYLNFSWVWANSFVLDNWIWSVNSSWSLKITSTQTWTLIYNYTVSNGFASKVCTDSVSIKPISKPINLDNSTWDATLTWTTTVWSWFSLIGEEIPSEIFSSSWEIISDLVSNDILDKSWAVVAWVEISPETKMYYSSWNLDFNKKYLNDLSLTNSGKIYSFSWIITLGWNETILLDTPAKITYFNKLASKIAYKKSNSSIWHIKDVSNIECSVSYLNPVCGYLSWNNTIIKTLHFTDFATLEVTDIPVVTPPSDNNWSTNSWTTTKTSSWGWWWWMTKDYCPTWDNSPSYYDRSCDGVSKTNSQTTNSTQSLLKWKTMIFKQSSYEIYYIVWYDLSNKTRRLSQYIINSKKLSNADKSLITKRINEFLVARYNLESANIKTIELQNIYAKASILLKASLNRLKK